MGKTPDSPWFLAEIALSGTGPRNARGRFAEFNSLKSRKNHRSLITWCPHYRRNFSVNKSRGPGDSQFLGSIFLSRSIFREIDLIIDGGTMLYVCAPIQFPNNV